MGTYHELEWIKSAENEQLTRWIAERQEVIKDLQERIKAIEETNATYQAELDRRAIEAYWEANPDLLRLNAGDDLMVTDGFRASKIRVVGSDSLYFTRDWKLGAPFKVGKVNPITGDGYIVNATGGTSCSYLVMVGMRRAYLEGQTNATK